MTTPFKHFLAECRKRIVAEDDDQCKTADLAVVDRWMEHADVNSSWEAVQNAATKDGRSKLWPGDLVEWVLASARQFQLLETEIIPSSKRIEEQAIATAEKNWRAARRGNPDLAVLAAQQMAGAHAHRENRLRILGRQQPSARRSFVTDCRALMIANCGQPLDEVIEVLLYVVSGKAAKAYEVRDLLKPRTREARKGTRLKK